MRLPRAWLGTSLDFSFSGLKTAVRRLVTAEVGGTADEGRPSAGPGAEVADAFQDSVVDVLATKTALRRRALRRAHHRARWRCRRERLPPRSRWPNGRRPWARAS